MRAVYQVLGSCCRIISRFLRHIAPFAMNRRSLVPVEPCRFPRASQLCELVCVCVFVCVCVCARERERERDKERERACSRVCATCVVALRDCVFVCA